MAVTIAVLPRLEAAARDAKLLHQFELPPTSLTIFGYSQEELEAAAPRGLVAFDRPAIGSGLIALGGAHFLGITDRGPNVDHFPVDGSCTATGGANGKTHPLPQFTPAIVKFRAHGGVLTLTEFVNLVTPAGEGITGLSNLLGADPAFDDPSFDDPCSNIALAANQNGMDVEDFALLPDGKFIGVEENRPSVFIGDLASGVVELRYTPPSGLCVIV